MSGEAGIPIEVGRAAAKVATASEKAVSKPDLRGANFRQGIRESRVGEALGFGKPKSGGEDLPAGAKDSTNVTKAPESSATGGTKIPDKVLADKEFIVLRDQLRSQAQGQGYIDGDAINRDALSQYYTQWAEATVANGVPDEIKNDPRFAEIVHDVSGRASASGEPLDMASIQKDALITYRQENDLAPDSSGNQSSESSTEDASAVQSPEVNPTEARLSVLEQNLNTLTKENGLLREDLAQVKTALAELLPIVKTLTENQMAATEDPKKKQKLLEILVKIATVAAMVMFQEVQADVQQVVGDKAA